MDSLLWALYKCSFHRGNCTHSLSPRLEGLRGLHVSQRPFLKGRWIKQWLMKHQDMLLQPTKPGDRSCLYREPCWPHFFSIFFFCGVIGTHRASCICSTAELGLLYLLLVLLPPRNVGRSLEGRQWLLSGAEPMSSFLRLTTSRQITALESSVERGILPRFLHFWPVILTILLFRWHSHNHASLSG